MFLARSYTLYVDVRKKGEGWEGSRKGECSQWKRAHPSLHRPGNLPFDDGGEEADGSRR